MGTRIALAVCVVLGCALCGRALADAARRRANALKGIAEGLRVLKIHMTGMLEPVQCALRSAKCPLFALVADNMGDGRSAGEAWQAARAPAMRRGGPAEALTASDARVLDALFDRLGQSGRAEQSALLAGAIRDVEALWDEAAKRAAETGRLYTALGFLIGMMIALIVV